MALLRTMVAFRNKFISMRDASSEQVTSGEVYKSIMFDKWKNATNIKNGNHYTLLTTNVINATNKNDGQQMGLYIRDGQLYVREINEFDKKFEI